MFDIKKEGVILEPRENEFENEGVFNPAVIERDGVVHMFYRAVKRGNFSTIGYCQLVDNKVVRRFSEPVLFPEHEYENRGLEDPRITLIDGRYHLFYTAYDGKNARVAYAVSEELPYFQKKGLVTPSFSYEIAGSHLKNNDLSMKYRYYEEQYKEKVGGDVILWEKDAFLFPEKIDGKYALVHRILPGIQIVYFNDFEELTNEAYWIENLSNLSSDIILEPKYWYENSSIGGGCPPIKTEKGWLFIYHATQSTDSRKVYHAAAALLDLTDPEKVLGRLHNPLFSPEEQYEKLGVINNVVFPTGTCVDGDKLTIYYGAADKVIAARSLSLSALVNKLVEVGP
ncbi:MAG: pesticidal protein Cry7Aa [Patescibacteria group bacterium]|jgi:predicted GH43/DUF377 family glycosyl hydrolase